MIQGEVNVLLVDDEIDFLEFIEEVLTNNGFKTVRATNGRQAISIATSESVQLILLDILMPEMDGIETCKELRAIKKLNNVPISFLSARSDDYTQIAGFNAGADDYIVKPVKPKVLVSRINALLRRVNFQTSRPIKHVDIPDPGLLIDKEKYLVTKDGALINLRRREFELLSFLASAPGKVFSREEILNRVWGNSNLVAGRTVDVHMNQLRDKVGERYFMTVKGVGYKYTT